MNVLRPCLDILPEPQRRFWPELRQVPRQFVLYGGTALALRLGHRSSADFDFFSSADFEHQELADQLPWLTNSERLQAKRNTLTIVVQRGGPIKVSFFGGLTIGRVGEPQETSDGILRVASLLDLSATKMAVIQQRAERKDYLDLAAILQSGLSPASALGAAQALYRTSFNPMISLKALSYFRDGDLAELPPDIQVSLSQAAATVEAIPTIPLASDQIA